MNELLSQLTELSITPGLPGYIGPVRELIKKYWQPFVDEFRISNLGNLYGYKRGEESNLPRVLITAHMDTIGLMVAGHLGQFIRITAVGGVDPRVLPGQLVHVFGKRKVTGVVIQQPQTNDLDLTHLLVDTGINENELREIISPGDLVSFANQPVTFENEGVCGPAMDNRASITTITHSLAILSANTYPWDIWAAATVGEETTGEGAATAAYEIKPTFAIIVDTTYGAGPGSQAHETYPLGGGPTLGWGPTVHPVLFDAFREYADRLEISYSVEVMPHSSDTDADTIQVAGQGIPSMVISIPIRNMHTPVELVYLADILQAGRLIAEFIQGVDHNLLNKLHWKA
jgi:putative aminopeptidase FrvX